MLARHCSGGLILGFSQFRTSTGVWKGGTANERNEKSSVAFPTPWNHIEAGILFSLGLPLLVFRERGILGGVFDEGVTDLFVQNMPVPEPTKNEDKALREVVRKWATKVQAHYYRP